MANGQSISDRSINTDFQVRVERWPEPSETLLGREYRMLGGGKAANVVYRRVRSATSATSRWRI